MKQVSAGAVLNLKAMSELRKMYKTVAWSSIHTMEVFLISKSQLHGSDVDYRLPLTVHFKASKMYSISYALKLSVIVFYVL